MESKLKMQGVNQFNLDKKIVKLFAVIAKVHSVENWCATGKQLEINSKIYIMTTMTTSEE